MAVLRLMLRVWIALLFAGVGSVNAIQVEVAPGQVLQINPSDAAIALDGQLNESIWTELDHYDEFVVIEPDTLIKPSHRTRVRLFHNDRGLFVGVEAEQPTTTLVARLSSRDNRQIKRATIGDKRIAIGV